jgi:hypothetical protein
MKKIFAKNYENCPKYKKISRNKFILLENWTFYSNIQIPKSYSNHYLIIKKTDNGSEITIKKGFEWNGATGGINFKNVIPGTLIHDAIYINMDEISNHWAIASSVVRKWGDKVFNEINTAFNLWRPIKKIYYIVVRIFGRFFT